MSTPRKKKKAPVSKPSDALKVSKEYFDQFSVTARKVLQILDLDPELYDQFTKKQKYEMMIAKAISPRFSVKEGHLVPRYYVKIIQKKSYEYLKCTCVGNPSIGLNYYDFTTMGMTFLMYMQSKLGKNTDCDQSEAYDIISKQADFHDSDGSENFMTEYCNYLKYLLFSISKVNFRIYGFDWEWGETKSGFLFAAHIILTSMESQRTYFTYQNQSRPAYKMIHGQFISPTPMCLTISYDKIYKDGAKTHDLDVYVQSHVLLRMKERLDVLSPLMRKALLFFSLRECNIIQLNSGKYAVKYINTKQEVIGYLPFTIIDHNLLVLTFLPLSNSNVPEGKKLSKILNVNKEDLKFCGMDKLSFFINTDFDAVPQLKEALNLANMWHLTELEGGGLVEEKNEKKLLGYTAKLFQQTVSELNREELLDEISNRY